MSTSKANTPSARESVYSTWMNIKNLSKGREIKGTIYNIGVVFGIASLVAFIFVLAPFLKPLLWAVLIGAVVYPMKREMSAAMHNWFSNLEKRDGNIFLNILVIPVRTMDSLGERFVCFVKEHKNVLIGTLITLVSAKFIYEFAPRRLLCYSWRVFMFVHTKTTDLLSQLSATILIGFLIAYLTMVIFLWRNSNQSKFMVAGQSLWLLLLAYGCSFLGPLQVPVFLVLMGYGIAGFIYSYKNSLVMDGGDSSASIYGAEEGMSKSITEKVKEFIFEQNKGRVHRRASSSAKEALNLNSTSGNDKSNLNLPLGHKAGDMETEDNEESSLLTSDMFFKVLFYSCTATVLFKNPFLLIISVVPVSFYFAKQLLQSTGAWSLFTAKVRDIQSQFDAWLSERYSAILPVCLPGVLELNRKIHNTMRDNIKSSIDLISSIVVIVLMLLIVVSLGIFFAAQIYSEGFQVAQLGHEVVQKAFVHRPELKNILPENALDNLVDNAHKYGRNTIETYIDGVLQDAEKEQAEKLKMQVLTTWDRLVQNMLERGSDEDSIGPKMGFGLKDSLEEIVDNTVVKEGIIAWAKSNVGMLKDVMDSVLIIVKSNIYLIASVLGSIFSVLLGGGYAVITFIVDTVSGIFYNYLFAGRRVGKSGPTSMCYSVVIHRPTWMTLNQHSLSDHFLHRSLLPALQQWRSLRPIGRGDHGRFLLRSPNR